MKMSVAISYIRPPSHTHLIHTPMLHLRPLCAPKEKLLFSCCLLLLFLLFLPAAQLRSVQEEMHSLEEEKESELAEAQEELRAAQEEVLLLQQAAEDAAAERENDIASLQEELCRRRAELQRLSEDTQEYELEITTLRAEISMKSQRREAERKEGESGGVGWGSGSCSSFADLLASLVFAVHTATIKKQTCTIVCTAVVQEQKVQEQKAVFFPFYLKGKSRKKKHKRDVPPRCALTSC